MTEQRKNLWEMVKTEKRWAIWSCDSEHLMYVIRIWEAWRNSEAKPKFNNGLSAKWTGLQNQWETNILVRADKKRGPLMQRRKGGSAIPFTEDNVDIVN